ncbi:MAG: STAS domain-containing protein [Planctomycetota bacterium]|jgi:anti-anti-sigma factor
MLRPTDSIVEATLDGGVVTAKIVTSSVNADAAQIILMRTRETMDQAGDGLTEVVLDFGGVESIDSSGLGTCFQLRNDVAEREAQVILYRPTETVLQLFMVVNMESLFSIVHTAEKLQSVLASQATDP